MYILTIGPNPMTFRFHRPIGLKIRIKLKKSNHNMNRTFLDQLFQFGPVWFSLNFLTHPNFSFIPSHNCVLIYFFLRSIFACLQ